MGQRFGLIKQTPNQALKADNFKRGFATKLPLSVALGGRTKDGSMTEQNEKKEQKCDELRLLYSACVSEIDSFKKQQWQTTNYGLLLYAAIVSIPKLLGTLNQVEYFILFVSAFSVAASGWYLVGVLAESIQIRRERLIETRKSFSKEFMNAWRYGKTEAKVLDTLEAKRKLLWFFRSVFLVGFGAVCWLLVRFVCAT